VTQATLIERRQSVLGPTYRNFYETPLHLVRGQGLTLWDADGREYLDAYNNVVSVGHCHPHVVEALTRQASTLNTHTRYLHQNIVELSEMLTEKLPTDIDVCLFVCTGTEANDLAIQFAGHITGNRGVVVTEASYHGNSELVRTLSIDSYPAQDRPDWLCVIEPPNLYRGPFTRDDANAGAKYLALAVEQMDALEKRGEKIGALLIDSVWDSNGPLIAPGDYVRGLCDQVRRRGGLIISDEVQSGYCRTGQNSWGCENYDFKPDIVTCGKPMGGGHPIALMATTRDIATQYSKKYHYFNTFGGNPVSTAVGKAVLEVIDNEKLLENARDTGVYFESKLRELAARHEAIGDVQGSGLYWGLDMIDNADSKKPFSEAQMRRLGSLIVKQGVITGHSGRYGQILKLRPPLPFGIKQVDIAVNAIDAALQEF
jgi:4-aminobutyrate aminotransferase-like enzyme